jgi:hypothetical protein
MINEIAMNVRPNPAARRQAASTIFADGVRPKR